MANNFDIEKLIEKVGGPFSLTVLLQKRLKELKAGATKLVYMDSKNLMEIACREILEGKVTLVPEKEKGSSSQQEIQSLFGNEDTKSDEIA